MIIKFLLGWLLCHPFPYGEQKLSLTEYEPHLDPVLMRAPGGKIILDAPTGRLDHVRPEAAHGIVVAPGILQQDTPLAHQSWDHTEELRRQHEEAMMRTGGMPGWAGAGMIAEGFKPEMADVKRYAAEHPGIKPEEVRAHFMERARNTANWSAFASAVGAFGVGMDVASASATARNAVDNNSGICEAVLIAAAISMVFEYPQYLRDLETDEPHVALGKMGIRVVEGTAAGLAGGPY